MEVGNCRSSGNYVPCAACKLLRRRCIPGRCIFHPYFPAAEPLKFASVHKVFGASNVSKILQDLPDVQRGDAVSSLVYEANARVKDPVYGCVGIIASLQYQLHDLHAELAVAQAEIARLRSTALQLQLQSTADALNLINYSDSGFTNYALQPMNPVQPNSDYDSTSSVLNLICMGNTTLDHNNINSANLITN